jgi:hypothetical protein
VMVIETKRKRGIFERTGESVGTQQVRNQTVRRIPAILVYLRRVVASRGKWKTGKSDDADDTDVVGREAWLGGA